MNEKDLLRKKLKSQLSNMPNHLYEQSSDTIAKLLYQQPEWNNSNTIGITISKQPEVHTRKIIIEAWNQKKTIVVPKCHPKSRKMEFREITDYSQLESVYYGLLEPIVDKTRLIHKEEIDLLIVPGLGYTRDGFRLGFGGGYYDRYLQNYSGHTISLAFQSQLVEELMVEGHDIAVKKIITDKEVIPIK
ncbi:MULTISPECIES: 5-formyltetrahydrofolate cyclo-ligase [unclassified Bacillus (in: firmicutes)]|uniref:5-formyltetrahydrofolate cyclo-ligase n=1 Tax=unclassified Bacillus (in: firmicutes) TaxID=185979 RepID=UPI0008E6A314|nr:MULTISPECIES: 5-formyltetrahydrofolate cyclo-ligase [unclassified Bacillus (in: firmicutes)]SFA96180.1 5-formyltetrahydrofolate cyclo-ligase [Bacillus sp. UNCCL13]SFQ79652.1 5-formyltetrahydrofolate cyclo-ligase [Bacillus sp. cl95]